MSDVAKRSTLDINFPSFLKGAFFNKAKYTCLAAGRRCFVGSTLVKIKHGYKYIKDIQKGDLVLSYDVVRNAPEYQPVINTFHFEKGGSDTKPLLSLKLSNQETIKCTYDHEFYIKSNTNGIQEGWFPAFVIAWGALDASSRNQLKVFCKQQGQNINDELQMYWSGQNNAASIGQNRLLQNNDFQKRQISNNQSSSRSSQSIYSCTNRQKLCQSQRFQQNQQCYTQLRVGDSLRKRSSLRCAWSSIQKSWRKSRDKQIKGSGCAGHPTESVSICNTQRSISAIGVRIWRKRFLHTRYSVQKNLDISCISASQIVKARVSPACDVYDLEVAGNNNYTITNNNYCVHNSGKTFNSFSWIALMLLSTPNKSGLWVDTTQRNLTEYVEIYLKKILHSVWHLIHYDKQGHKITFPNSSFLHLRSAERPENMEGFEYDYIVCNEAGIIFKTNRLWTNTIMPMAKNAQVKLVGTPKGFNYFHNLFNNAGTDENWESYRFSAYDSIYWQPGQLDAIKKDPSVDEEIWLQEYEGRFIAGLSFSIIKRTFKESWRDNNDVPYTIEHDWIQKQLNDKGYYFIAFDGGMHTTHSAAILGYHNERFDRDILLKEFYNEHSHEDLREVSMKVKEFCEHNRINYLKARLYADPAVKTYGDDEHITTVLDNYVNTLEHLTESENPRLKGFYTNRKEKRLQRLATDVYTMRSDNKPAFIILKDKPSSEFGYGCPFLYQGIFEGQYRRQVKDIGGKPQVTKELEQNPPLTDICDAYSYYVLAERPIVFNANDNLEEDRASMRAASSGW